MDTPRQPIHRLCIQEPKNATEYSSGNKADATRIQRGIFDSYMVGDLPNFGTVWYNDKSLANILSLSDVRK